MFGCELGAGEFGAVFEGAVVFSGCRFILSRSHSAGFYLNPKDHLENSLKHLVCRGSMTLAAAQLLAARHWPAAFRTYG